MDLSEKILVFFLIVIVVGEVLTITYPTVFQNYTNLVVTNTAIQTLGENTWFNATIRITQGNSPQNVRVLLIPEYQEPEDKDIYVYYDKNYPSTLSLNSWKGLLDHLEPNLKLRGYTGKITVVNALTLADIMKTYFDAIVIVPSGVFPDTVHKKNESLVPNFLDSGGTLIWIGDGFAAYSGEYLGTLQWPSEENPGWDSQTRILGYQLTYENPQQNTAYTPTLLSQGLNLGYPIVESGAFISQTLEHDGLVLGTVSNERTSIAAVPVGEGHLVVFGGGMGAPFTGTGEDTVAYDIANILLSNVLQSKGQISVANFTGETDVTQTVTVKTNRAAYGGITLVAYSVDEFTYFFQREFFKIS